MKPHKLILQAFGPFASTQCVEFDRLGDNPLFLINGDTGSGKSTILDAICFALYGQTTGNERSGTDMRCDFARNDLLTEITFDFSLGNKSYRIRRVPTQARAKKRATKKAEDGPEAQAETTTQNATASLWELGANPEDNASNTLLVSSKVSEADREIKALLGLDAEQFRQVMVLPQGRFRQLLLADSKERENIFSQLFQTSIYKKIEETLKLKSSLIKKEVEEHQNKIKGILEGADLNSEDEVISGLEELRPLLLSSESEKEQALKLLKTAESDEESAKALIQKFEVSQQKNAELIAHKSREAEINLAKEKMTNAQHAQKIQPLFALQESLSQKLAALKGKQEASLQAVKHSQTHLASMQSQLEDAITAQKSSAGLQTKLSELDRYQSIATKLNSARKELTEAENHAANSQNKLNDQQKQLTQSKEAIAQHEQTITELVGHTEQIAQAQLAVEKSRQVLERYQEINALNASLNALQHQAEQAQTVLKDTEQEYTQQETKTKQTELAWHNGQAALLAKELETDMPCPVCGSKDHPKLAISDGEQTLISKQTLDLIRDKLTAKREKRDQAKTAYQKLCNDIQALIDTLNKQKIGLGDSAQNSFDEIKLEHSALEKNVANLLAYKGKLTLVRTKLESDRGVLTKLEQGLSDLQHKANADKELSVSVQTKVQSFEQDLPEDYRDTTRLQQEISATTTVIDKLSQQLQQAQTNKDNAQTAFDTASATHKSLAKQSEELESESKQASTQWEQALLESMFNDQQSFNAALLTDAQIRLIQSDINHYQSTLDTLTGAVKQLETELANKSRPDMDKIKQAKQGAAAVFSEKEKHWQALDARKNTLLKVHEKLKIAHKTNQALEEQYRVVGTLYEVSNGLSGDRVSLQRFVLSVLLDDVLIQASERLLLMSKGRYRLIRKEDKAKGNKASGLELEVEDAYTGKTRSVATLSGGESFIAALALALGLSDAVQSYSGGIKLDTLFIDEGFGSLDPESLELAIRTLIDLQTMGRTIGIISHVTELKSQMALRIDVKSGRGGSEIVMAGL